MRRLVLMRHAKAQHSSPGSDHDRRLAPRGIQDAQEAGVALRRLGIDAALVSSAARTRETFEALGLGLQPIILDDLYFGGTDTAEKLIAATDEAVTSLLVVGHAPTIPDLAAELLLSGNPREADRVGSWFPTSAYSRFTIVGPWATLFGTGGASYEGTMRPATNP